MKKTYGTILVLSAATLVLLTASVACLAEEEEKVWRDEGPRHLGGQFELTDEVIEHMMERLRETNPERAKELAKLREKKPKQFEAQLREMMREHMRFRAGRGPGTEAGAPFGGRGGFGGGPGGRGPTVPGGGTPIGGRGGLGGGRGMRDREGRGAEGRGRGMMREGLHERYAEFLEWLEENYLEEAEQLADLREEKPDLYMRQFWLSYRKYRRVFEASEENPQLVEVLKEDLVLKDRRDKLLKKIGAASEDEKEELTEELEELVSSRFDLIVRRKQITYEQLRKELEELKEQVKKSEAEVEKWKEMKGEKVKERLEELIGRTEKFDWY